MAEGRCRLNQELAREVLLVGSDFLEVLQRGLQTIFPFCPLDHRLFYARECASVFPVHQKLRNYV